MPGEEQPSPGILFFKEIVQLFQSIFPVAGRGRCSFPEYKIITEICLVPSSLKLCLWLRAFIVGRFRIEPAVQAYMEITVAFWTG